MTLPPTRMPLSTVLLIALLLVVGRLWAAQESLVGYWLVTIEGEADTRSLNIQAEAPAPEGGILLVAKYGISRLGTGPVEARIVRSGNQRQLLLTTQAAAKIIAAELPDGSFDGTFTFKNGVVKKLSITRATEEALDLLRVAQTKPVASAAPKLIEAPGADVPANCSAFSGGWGGTWPRAGYASLWVVSIAPDCSAKVIYPAGPRQPSPTSTRTEATIKGSTLSLRRPDGGTTTFELTGGALSARYSGPAGVNDATMSRIDDPAAQAKAEADLRMSTAMVPPSSDVPADCAAYQGHWVGTWAQGAVGDAFLRIVEVRMTGSRCTVRYSYSPSRNLIPASETADLKSGSLSFVCNSSTGGTCVFERSGDSLSATYTNPAGGRNSATFRRVQ